MNAIPTNRPETNSRRFELLVIPVTKKTDARRIGMSKTVNSIGVVIAKEVGYSENSARDTRDPNDPLLPSRSAR